MYIQSEHKYITSIKTLNAESKIFPRISLITVIKDYYFFNYIITSPLLYKAQET